MKDEAKTKEQLITELAEMRQRITKLEKSEAERVKTEEALRESEEKYRTLFEAESDTIFLVDEKSLQILEANNAAVKMYGYSQV